jgi:hypothetical protein
MMKKQSCNVCKKPHHDHKRERGGLKVEGKIIRGMKKKEPNKEGAKPLQQKEISKQEGETK